MAFIAARLAPELTGKVVDSRLGSLAGKAVKEVVKELYQAVGHSQGSAVVVPVIKEAATKAAGGSAAVGQGVLEKVVQGGAIGMRALARGGGAVAATGTPAGATGGNDNTKLIIGGLIVAGVVGGLAYYYFTRKAQAISVGHADTPFLELASKLNGSSADRTAAKAAIYKQLRKQGVSEDDLSRMVVKMVKDLRGTAEAPPAPPADVSEFENFVREQHGS